MALAVADRVKESTTTTGTGTVSLAGAETGFQTFVAGIGNSNTTYYAIVDGNTGDFEVGIGTVTDASPDTLSRDTILQSSNSDSAVNFGSGTKAVFCTQPADKAVFKNADGNVNLPDSAEFQFGNRATTGDLRIRHNGTQSQIQNYTGQLQITNFTNDSDVRILSDDSSGGVTDYFRADGSNGEAVLYHYGTEKFATKSTGVDVVGNITVSGTVDGRDLATDGTKLDGVEASADVTDATNVTAAGALMDSEVTNLAQVKAFDSSDYATAAQGTTADNALPKAGGTMTGNLTLSGTNTRINMPDDHFINRRFELDAVDASGVGYVLLCRNAASNDVNGRITMDRTSGLRHACQVDIIVSSGSSTNPIGSLKAHGVTVNAGSSPNGPSYELVTVTYDSDSNSYVALKITNPDNYYETSGAFFTGRLVNSGSNTLLAVLPSGISSEAQLTDTNAKHTFQGDLDILDNIVIAGTVDGRDIATDGTKLDGIEASADVTDTANVTSAGALMDSEVTNLAQVKAFDSSDYATAAQGTTADNALPKAGGTMTGAVLFNDSVNANFGTGTDLSITHNGTNTQIINRTGVLQILQQSGSDVVVKGDDNSGGSSADYFRADGSTGEAMLYHYGTEKLATKSGGVDVSGNITVSGTVDGRDLATDGTKLDGIEASATADQTASEIRTLVESASDSNVFTDADHTKLNAIASSATANPNAIDNVVEDTTPQLGGVLDTNGNNIEFGDSTGAEVERLKFGAGDDLQIYHDGSDSYLADVGTGNLKLLAGSLRIRNGADTADLIEANNGGAVRLYHNNSAKFATTSSGVDVTGNIVVSGTVDGRDVAADGATADAALPKAGGTMTGNLSLGDSVIIKLGDSQDLQLFHNGTNSQINTSTGNLVFQSLENDKDVVINSDDGSGSTANYFRADGSNGEAVLYHYGTEKLATKSGGVDVSGNITVSGTVDGRDLATDGTKLDGIEASADVTDATNVTAAGALMDSEVTNLAQVKSFDSSDYATAAQGTTADAALPKAGGTMTGNLSRGDNVKSIYGAGNDLEIYHTGTNSIINDVGTGNLVLSTNGTSVRIAHSTNGEAMAIFTKNGSALLKHDGSDKLETSSSGVDVTGDIAVTGSMVFEGATADAHETTLAVTDPTADRTITLPDATGTVILNSNLNFPFFKADGSSDTIALTADNKLPFVKSDGSASNIALTT